MIRPLAVAAGLFFVALVAACGDEPGAGEGADGSGNNDGRATEPGQDGGDGGPRDDAAAPVTARLDVKVGSTSVAVRRGGSAKLPVSVARVGTMGSITLDVVGLPAGLTVAPVVVAAADTTATLSFAATPQTALGKTPLTLRARGDGLKSETALDATVYDGEQLDPSFGSNGVVVWTTGTRPFFGRAVAVLSDSKLVVGGDFDSYAGKPGPPLGGFVRFATNGSVDAAFGTSGILTPSPQALGGYEKTLLAGLAADGAGGFVGVLNASFAENAGKAKSDVVLVAVRADGTLDPAFGSGGVTKIDLGDTEYDGKIARDASGRYLVTSSVEIADGRDAVVSRYLANGQLDTTYGTGGRLRTQFGGEKPYAFEVKAYGNLAVISGSRYQTGTNTIHGFVSRISAAGSIDATFGSGGFHDQTYQVMDLDIASDGRVYLDNSSFWRLLTNGTPDLSYGPAGKAPQNAADIGFHRGVTLAAADGHAYRLRSGTYQAMHLWSYGANGVADAAFGGGGSIEVPLASAETPPDVVGLVYTPDGRAVGLGNRFGASGRITLVRFLL